MPNPTPEYSSPPRTATDPHLALASPAAPDAATLPAAAHMTPVSWTTLQWIQIARVVLIMGIPVVLGAVSGAWWFAGFKAKLELEDQAMRARIEATEKALVGLSTVPSQLAALTARFDTWAQVVGLPMPKTPKDAGQ